MTPTITILPESARTLIIGPDALDSIQASSSKLAAYALSGRRERLAETG